MGPSSPYVVTLGEADRRALEALARRGCAEHRQVLRARIVLAAAGGDPNVVIAQRLATTDDTVRKWRKRFCRDSLPGLADRPRSGRPRKYPATVVAEVKALACEPPSHSGAALARWSCPELAREAVGRGICGQLSATTVRRWLATDVLKPWQHRSWIFPRDPYFAVKAARVLDLYDRVWDGEPLGDKDFVISADEKPGIQARPRIHPSLPAGPGRAMRIEHEYARRGTLAYFAAYDVHHARVFAGGDELPPVARIPWCGQGCGPTVVLRTRIGAANRRRSTGCARSAAAGRGFPVVLVQNSQISHPERMATLLR